MKRIKKIIAIPKSPGEVVAEFLGSGTALAGFDEYYTKHTSKIYRVALQKAIGHTANELAISLNQYLMEAASGPGASPYLTVTSQTADRILGLNFV